MDLSHSFFTQLIHQTLCVMCLCSYNAVTVTPIVIFNQLVSWGVFKGSFAPAPSFENENFVTKREQK